MKILKLIVLVAAALILSCKGGEDYVEIPENVIPPDTLINILIDIHLAEASLQYRQQQGQDIYRQMQSYYEGIFKKYHITRHDLDTSLNFYTYHPKLIRTMYEKVLSELSTRHGENFAASPDKD